MSTCNELQEIRYPITPPNPYPLPSVSAADGCSSPGGRVPVRVARGPADGWDQQPSIHTTYTPTPLHLPRSYNEIEVKERCNISPTTTIHL